MNKHDEYLFRKYEDYDHVCFECLEDIDILSDSFDIEWSDSNKTKEVMYHSKCFQLLTEEENRNPDEPDIFVEHKI